MPRLSVGSDDGQRVEPHHQDVGAGRPGRPAFLDGFTAESSDARAKGLLDRTSGAVGEQQRQYALRSQIANWSSSRAARAGSTPRTASSSTRCCTASWR